MKRETKIGIGLLVFILIGVAWPSVSRYLRLSSQCSRESRESFVSRMELITNGVSRAEVIRIVGEPDELQTTQGGDQMVYRWKGLSGFSFDSSRIQVNECLFAFNIRDGVVDSFGRSPFKDTPNPASQGTLEDSRP